MPSLRLHPLLLPTPPLAQQPLLRKLRMLPVGLRMLPVGLNVPIALLLRLPLPSSSLVLAIGDHKLVAFWEK